MVSLFFFRAFWLSWDAAGIYLGSGVSLGENPITELAVEDEGSLLHFVSVATGEEVTGQFAFERNNRKLPHVLFLDVDQFVDS